MRLIDANALMPKLKFIREAEHQIYGKESWGFASKCITAVEDAPIIEERKTGKWTISETAYDDTEAKCSECGFVTLVNEPGNGLHMLSDLRFCPNCGAKMEGEQ